MRVSIVITVFTLLASASPAHAQDPNNVTVHVTELSRIFTELYGPNGLVVNSLASLAGGVSHSATSTAASRASSPSSAPR